MKAIVKLWVDAINAGTKTLDDVPAKLHDEVEEALRENEAE